MNAATKENAALVKTANISTITRDLVPALEDIHHVVPDSKITAEYDMDNCKKGNDRKSESDSPSLTTKKATVEQKAKETSERVETRAKGGTPSKYINPPVHFGIDTILSPVALNSPSKI
ncbi:hypothetical protein ACOME3_010350 [Neoechinorhynchus agilis]